MSGFGHPGGFSNPPYADANRYNQDEGDERDHPAGNQQHPANSVDQRFWQPESNCGQCRNYWRFDPDGGLIKCPDPRCKDAHVIDPNARPQQILPPQVEPRRVLPAPSGPVRPPPPQISPAGPTTRGPENRRNRVPGRIGRPVGTKNSNQRGTFLIDYNPVDPATLAQPDPNDPFQQVPAYTPVGRFFLDPEGRSVMWTGTFGDIMTPQAMSRGKGRYPYDPRHDWRETSYANAAPRGCIDNEPEPEHMYRRRQKKWDDFVRACYFWDKMYILEQMGADPRSFPFIEGIHGKRLRGKLSARTAFEEERDRPGGWKGPWPPGVRECEQAKVADSPNMLRTRCNKCKELGILGCSWTMKTCQNCLDNGYMCVRTMDYRPTPFPRTADQQESAADRKKRLWAQRKADQAAFDAAAEGEARRTTGGGNRVSPYPAPNPAGSRGRGSRSSGPGPVRNIPGRQTAGSGLFAYAPLNEGQVQEEIDEDQLFLARSRLQVHPLIEHLRMEYQLWTNEAEDMATNLYIFEEQNGYVIPRTVREVGNSTEWLSQFPPEVITRLRQLEQLLKDHNAPYPGGQHMVDRTGFNTLRQRRNLIRRQRYVTEQFLAIPLAVEDRWKCYRCYHFGLNCNVDTQGCQSCRDANHFCQRSHQYTMEMRHDIVEAAGQANAAATRQANMPPPGQDAGFNAGPAQGPGGFPAAEAIGDPNNPMQNTGRDFIPCQNCVANGIEHFCGPETPCIMCVSFEDASNCRPGQRRQALNLGGPIPAVADTSNAASNDWPASVGQQGWRDIYGGDANPFGNPTRPPNRGGLGFENDITHFEPAGPPNQALFGAPPREQRGPTVIQIGDVYDPDNLLGDEDQNMDLDTLDFGAKNVYDDLAAAIRDPSAPRAQLEPRFPLADEPWDGAAFATDATWDPFLRMMIRTKLLQEINPQDEDAAGEIDGCEEAPMQDNSMSITCNNLPVEKCKYVQGSVELGDHPNPSWYVVCQPHTVQSKNEYRERARATWKEARAWLCMPCYKLFGDERVRDGKIRERDDSRLVCSCKQKYEMSTLCLTHTKKSWEAVEARVRRYHSASMAKFGYLACGNCFSREGNPGFDVYHCLGCNEACWKKSDAFRTGRY